MFKKGKKKKKKGNWRFPYLGEGATSSSSSDPFLGIWGNLIGAIDDSQPIYLSLFYFFNFNFVIFKLILT